MTRDQDAYTLPELRSFAMHATNAEIAHDRYTESSLGSKAVTYSSYAISLMFKSRGHQHFLCVHMCMYMYTFLFNEYPIIATFACIHRISEIQAKFHCKFHDEIFIRDIITTSRMLPFYFIMYVIICCYHIVIVRNWSFSISSRISNRIINFL